MNKYKKEIIEVEEIKHEYETIIIFDINTKITEINDIKNFIKQDIYQEPKFDIIGIKNYTTKNSDLAFYINVKTFCSSNNLENFNNYLKRKSCVLKFLSVIFEK